MTLEAFMESISCDIKEKKTTLCKYLLLSPTGFTFNESKWKISLDINTWKLRNIRHSNYLRLQQHATGNYELQRRE